MIEPIMVFLTHNDAGASILVFQRDFDRIEDGETIPGSAIYDALTVLDWCRDRTLRVEVTDSRLTSCSTGAIHFGTPEERFEFKIRWGI